MCRLSLNEKWRLLLISIHHRQMRHGVNSTGLRWVNTHPLWFTPLLLACLLENHQLSQTATTNQATIVVRGFTWYVPPTGVVEFSAEVLAQSRQIWFPVWRFIHVRWVEQHLAIGGAARTLDLLQQTPTFGVVGREDLRSTGRGGLIKWALMQDCGSGSV